MDIRNYFTSKKEKKVKDDDSDVIPESPDVRIKEQKKQSRKRRQIADDSDEEIFQKNKNPKSCAINDNSKTKYTSSKHTFKEVKVCDIFSSSIKRTEPIVKKEKKKTEISLHSDDEFEKSLLEIDEFAELEKLKSLNDVNTKTNKKSPQKHETKSTTEEKQTKHYNKPPALIDKHIQEIDKTARKIKTDKETNGYTKIKIEKETAKEKQTKSDEPTASIDKHIQEIDKTVRKTRTDKETNSNTKVKIEKGTVKEKQTKNDESSAVIDKQIQEKDKTPRKRKADEETNGDSTMKVEKETAKEKQMKNDETNKLEKKKDFREFLESDNSLVAYYDDKNHEAQPKRKKQKVEKGYNELILLDEERHERKRYSAALYQKYLNRSGPKHLGAKEIPNGAPNCLKDCAFLLTGVLDSFERDEVVAAITKYGGVVKSGISKKVTHVLAGDDAGPAKLAKAQDLGIEILNEDKFLHMISDSLNKNSNDNKSDKCKTEYKSPKKREPRSSEKDKKHINESIKKNTKIHKDSNGIECDTKAKVRKEKKSVSPKKIYKEIIVKDEPTVKEEKTNINGDTIKPGTAPSLMWVDKYKPQNLKQIIGQHGDASNVKKLTNWLTKWYSNREAKLPKPNPWAKNDDGGYYKAALLSGPPGVGKTTTVSLVCKELGFDAVEFNASDTRNKTLIHEQIGQLLTSTSLSGYAKGVTGKGAVTKKHVLVMDEVDGMAGNEDRGGLQELISLIKSSSVPIICICNDRNSEKMRSLVNYCYDLRFSRPRADQIKAAMMSICFKEGVKVPADVMGFIISAAANDVRQVLHLLAMWAADQHRPHSAAPTKDVKMGPWEAIRKVFTAEEHKTMSINDKSDLFFTDYSLMPLFVQENYLNVAPSCPKHEVLDKISKAADSMSLGDLVDSRIRSGQSWSLLPVQAMYSSVIPGHECAGRVCAQIQFPGWLGRNSRASKLRRLAQEIHAHTRLSTTGSKSSIFLDYATHLRDAVVNPLIKDRNDGIDQSLNVLESYRLVREDLDSLTELSLWPGQRNPTLLIDSKVKAAMTRTYNKKAAPLPYLPQTVKKGRARNTDSEEYEVDDEEDDDDSDPEKDVLIKKKKETEKSSKTKSSTSKKKK